MNLKSEYYATISWNECIVDSKVTAPAGEHTFYRERLDWLIESIKEYLEQWKDRGAYLETASEEYDDPSGYRTRFVDHTEYIKSKLQGGE